MSLQGVQKPYVKLQITSNLTSGFLEKNFQRSLRIGELKSKLELITGCDYQRVQLELFHADGSAVMALTDDGQMLGAYPVEDGMRLHCTDDSKSAHEFEIDEAEEEVACGFEMTDEEYDKRPNTFRRWLKENKLGRYREIDPEEQKRAEEEKARAMAEELALLAAMAKGDRCEVALNKVHLLLPSDLPCRASGCVRGTVMFVGPIGAKPEPWVGVRLDEPFGVCDGSAQDVRYFECRPKYGVFARPQAVSVGDFPELGIEDLDEI